MQAQTMHIRVMQHNNLASTLLQFSPTGFVFTVAGLLNFNLFLWQYGALYTACTCIVYDMNCSSPVITVEADIACIFSLVLVGLLTSWYFTRYEETWQSYGSLRLPVGQVNCTVIDDDVLNVAIGGAHRPNTGSAKQNRNIVS